MRKFITVIIIVVTVCFAYSFYAMPGENLIGTALLKGKVTDESGRPLEYVSVTIQDLGLAVSTGKSGDFIFTEINSGIYIVTFRLSGYKPASAEVRLSGRDTVINIILKESLIETEVIDVTGSFNAEDISKSTLSVTEINGRKISKTRSQTLAETIGNIPGISNLSTGSGIGKPVIRGLTSQSVLIIHDGVKHESQSWGDEHGPELSMFDLEKIEILRGPASLMYGADALGGVINVISKPLEFASSRKPVYYGNFVLGGFSVDDQLFGNLTLGSGFKNFGIKGHFGYRKSGNVKTPEGLFEVNTPGGKKSINGGELFNSGTKELQGGVNLGLHLENVSLNMGFETFDREIQIHEDPDEAPGAAPNQKINTNQVSLEGVFDLGRKLKLEPVFSFQSQLRREFESIEEKENGIEALHLDFKSYDASVKLHHKLSENLSGTFGGSFNFHNNKSLAEEKLIPGYHAFTSGIFITEKLSAKKISLSAGARFDYKNLDIKETVFESDSTGAPVSVVNAQTLSFNALTGSLGVAYNPADFLSAYFNIGRGWRAPSEFELFVNGVHEGTGRFERGLKTLNPDAVPKPEASLSIDAGIRLNYKSLSLQLSLYRNQVDNFIFPAPTGDTLEGHPVFDIVQDKSLFWGYEYNAQFQPIKWLILTASGDFVRTENIATGRALPFTPPMKNLIEAKLQNKSVIGLLNAYIRFSVKVVSPQTNIDFMEAETAGYTLLNAGAGFEFEFAKTIASVDFSADNLANTKYVDHLSRYKSYALNPGRSFNLYLSLPFKL